MRPSLFFLGGSTHGLGDQLCCFREFGQETCFLIYYTSTPTAGLMNSTNCPELKNVIKQAPCGRCNFYGSEGLFLSVLTTVTRYCILVADPKVNIFISRQKRLPSKTPQPAQLKP